MSLRYQINLRILVVSVCVLLLGGSIAIWQARNAVNKEVDSSIKLAVQLIRFAFLQAPDISQAKINEDYWISQINELNQTRYLTIQLKKSSGELIDVVHKKHQPKSQKRPPQWFASLIESQRPQAEYSMANSTGKQLTLIIQANPLDEITEVWEESIRFLGSLLLLTLFTFLAVNLAFNKALKAIGLIVKALKIIETGQYQQKLPDFSIQEYDSIAKAINHMADVLNVSQQENQELAQHSLNIQEEERQRLSQELHDELGQSLTAIKVMAVAAERAQAEESKAGKIEIKQVMNSIVSVCDHLMIVVGSMMHQLHPLILSELGLKATLEDLLNHWAVRNPALSISLNSPDEVDLFEQKISIQVFRIVQECITNSIRHAKASKVVISLEILQESATRSVLRLQVTDDGQGCSLEKLKTGFGLLGMRQRVNSLTGELTIKTLPNEGMSIIAIIPVK
ncbi:MAG: ATP-binding protein [Methylococcales bacterium]|jgi:two-component system sensor histidine kinase UhpB